MIQDIIESDLSARPTRRILVTDFSAKNHTESEIPDVMVFTTLTVDELKKAMGTRGTFTDCYEVPGEDLSLYLYDPLFLTRDDEAVILHRINKA